MFDLAVDLSQGLLATHRQHRMTEPDKHDDPGQMADPGSVQPSQRLLVERNYTRVQWVRRQLDGPAEHGDGAPYDQNHDHHCSNDHDLQGLLTRFVDALNVLPPE